MYMYFTVNIIIIIFIYPSYDGFLTVAPWWVSLPQLRVVSILLSYANFIAFFLHHNIPMKNSVLLPLLCHPLSSSSLLIHSNQRNISISVYGIKVWNTHNLFNRGENALVWTGPVFLSCQSSELKWSSRLLHTEEPSYFLPLCLPGSIVHPWDGENDSLCDIITYCSPC